MRPKLITPRKIILALLAIVIFAGLVYWLKSGGKVPFIDNVPSTAGKLVYVSEQKGGSDLYMTDGITGANTVSLTNDNKGMDAEPVWSKNGEQIALTSDRSGPTRQLYIMNAVSGAPVTVRTNSSTTKEMPEFSTEDLYFLDGGRISKLSPNTGDLDAIFPTAEQKRKALADIFSSGGVTRYAVSPDGSVIFAAVKQENGEALLAYTHDDGTVAVFGVAERVLFRYLPDSSLVAVFCGGAPLPQAAALLTADLAKNPEYSAPAIPPLQKMEQNDFVKIAPNFKIQPIVAVPFAPNGLAVSADGTRAVVTNDKGQFSGVFSVPLTAGGAGGPISDMPSADPAISPDGARVAFASKGDIYTLAITGGEPPVNLTKGQGTNHMPIWSPAKKQ